MNRVQLSRKYKSSVQNPLTFVGDPGIRMTYVSYRAIFEIYFAWLGLPLLLFFFEMRRKIRKPFPSLFAILTFKACRVRRG